MTRPIDAPRWNIWLPVAALLAAALMTALAATTQQSMVERNELALEGRLLGLAHTAEERLRETGVDSAEQILGELLPDGGADVVGLVLVDSSDESVAAVGRVSSPPRVRSVGLFLGRFAGGGEQSHRRPSGQRGSWAPGRGRFELRLHLDPRAGALPLVARLIVPATALIGIALVWLAILSGRFLVRQRHMAQEDAQRRRLEALARAGAGLAHQLRTPLATIKGTIQLMAEQCDNNALQPRLETVIGQTDRMNRLLGRLLDYVRPPEPEPQVVSLREIAGEIVDRHAGAMIEVPEGATAFVDPEHLVEILDNLLTNAVFFSPPGGSVLVRVSQDNGETQIRISDRGPGPGVNPELLFEPYVTSRSDGTGLGLPIARTLAEANQGSLRLNAPPGGGCEAVLTLPRLEKAP